ncbi:hypothetical protein [Paenibacillus sp. O199]|uniref:hypothetical protein n=1 Tax=Paenibacillus sp. O199 TaxID=1643925 RepID=UPI000B12E48F|nr:hypothetical protein [Paenibacillus sp. O199]
MSVTLGQLYFAVYCTLLILTALGYIDASELKWLIIGLINRVESKKDYKNENNNCT